MKKTTSTYVISVTIHSWMQWMLNRKYSAPSYPMLQPLWIRFIIQHYMQIFNMCIMCIDFEVHKVNEMEKKKYENALLLCLSVSLNQSIQHWRWLLFLSIFMFLVFVYLWCLFHVSNVCKSLVNFLFR